MSVKLGWMEQVENHESVLTHGFELGYATAKADDRVDFTRRFLASHTDDIGLYLTEAGGTVTASDPERGLYGVMWRTLSVTFP